MDKMNKRKRFFFRAILSLSIGMVALYCVLGILFVVVEMMK